MQIIIKIIILLFLITSFSCRELVRDDFPDYKSIPTVNSILVEGKPLSVLVSKTGKLNSTPLPTVDNATIDLYIDGEFSEQLEYTDSGTYLSKTIIEPEKEYKCRVIIPNCDTIICSQKLPCPSQILNIEHINIAGRSEQGNTYPAIKITFKNDLLKRKYYEVVINYFFKETIGDKIVQRSAFIHTISDPVILNEGLPIALFSNEIIKDSIYTMILNYSSGSSSSIDSVTFRTTLNPFIVEFRSVTYDYYRFKKQYYLYNQGRWADGLLNPMTVSPLYSNIENGYGIFAGYSVSATDTIKPEPYED